ncbi:MAG TPA: lysozyme inhibitor LprI family protein [Reyranella sp.]|nr:lysozyme inhibitor LprI family protein [Reyranella sp.]
MKRLAALLLLLAAPALAQERPSFDCAKATTVVERTICARPELARADRNMAAAYFSLSSQLSGPAKEHLLKDQGRWLAARSKACDGVAETMPLCLRQHTEAREANLRALGEGLYPFVSEQTFIKSGKVGRASYGIDVAWPQFDGNSADFTAVNRGFAEDASKAVDGVMPTPDMGTALTRDQTWTLLQRFELQRPSARAVAVATNSYAYNGGTHGYGGRRPPWSICARAGWRGLPRCSGAEPIG